MSVRLPDIKIEKDYDAKINGTNERYEKLLGYWNTIKEKVTKHRESIKIESYMICSSPDFELQFSIFGLKCFMRFKYHLIGSRPGNSIIQYGSIAKNEETRKYIRVHITDVELDENGNIVCPSSEKGRIPIDDFGKVHSFVLSNIMESLAEATHDMEEIEEIEILEDWEDLEKMI
jgi:hypothetical protein